ncbi:CapA family protein [Virgisporangium ochraceum]|uniref:CapA family protein n=1 Tax=Virgisporangium ochraceum TaxID=65505 RepID=UPI0019409E1D|nr:CapA family protein [Virgisporangium ochraceum]
MPSPSPSPFTLAVAGDVHFTGRTAPLLRDPATAIGPLAPVLQGADVAVLNLETAVTERGTPEPKEFHFRAPASAYAAVRAAGVDAVSLANNHVLDYGQVGLADTLDAAAAAGMPVFGAGRDARAAYAPWVTTVRGTRVAVLGFSQITTLAETWGARDDRPGVALSFDAARVRAAVAAARTQADVVVAFNHWGPEGDGCPSQRQKDFLAILVQSGVDIVLGAHAHVLQGVGWSGRTFVAYGMGNFVWYGTSRSTETGVLLLTIRGRDVLGWDLVPAAISATGQPVPLSGAAAERLEARFAGLRGCAGLTAAPG